jgi:hypothetical protein
LRLCDSVILSRVKKLTLLLVSALSLSAAAQSLDDRVQRELPKLLETYKSLHATPELSTQEEKTSAFLAARLRELGYEVTEKVGKYKEPGTTAYGVVAVLRNGTGPTVLVRTDMDGLPVTEQTGLDYASKNAGVMHGTRRPHDHVPRHREAARRSEVAVARYGDAHRTTCGRDRPWR